MDDIVDSMEEFETAKEARKGAIAMMQSTTLVVGDIMVELKKDRIWEEATYQTTQTPISLFQDFYKNRPDQRNALEEMDGAAVVDRAIEVDS